MDRLDAEVFRNGKMGTNGKMYAQFDRRYMIENKDS